MNNKFVNGLNLVYAFLQLHIFLVLYVQGFNFSHENMKPTRTVSSRMAYSVCEQRHIYLNTGIVQKPVKNRPVTTIPVPCGWFKLDNETISFKKCGPNSSPGKMHRKNPLLSGQLAQVKKRRMTTTKLPEQLLLVPSSREPSNLVTKKSPLRSIIKGYLKSNLYAVARKLNMITPPVPSTKARRLITVISNNNNYSIRQNASTEKYPSMTIENNNSSTTRTLTQENRDGISTNSKTGQKTTASAGTSTQQEKSTPATALFSVQNETSTMSNEIYVTSSVHYDDPHYEILSQDKSTGVIQKPKSFFFLCISAILILLHTF